MGIGNVILAGSNAISKMYGLNEKVAKDLANIIINPQKSVEVLNKIVKNAKTAEEKTLIQKFTEDLSKKNFTGVLSPSLGRAMATEQLQTEENNAF